MADLNFNAHEVAPAGAFEPLPEGDYIVHIVESEMRETRAGDGQYLELVLEVIEGNAKGRRLFDRLNLANPNPRTVEIARGTLSAICHVVGVMNLTDSEQLHFKPLKVSVRVRPAGPDRQGVKRDASNAIREYAPVNEDAPKGFASERPKTSQGAWRQG